MKLIFLPQQINGINNGHWRAYFCHLASIVLKAAILPGLVLIFSGLPNGAFSDEYPRENDDNESLLLRYLGTKPPIDKVSESIHSILSSMPLTGNEDNQRSTLANDPIISSFFYRWALGRYLRQKSANTENSNLTDQGDSPSLDIDNIDNIFNYWNWEPITIDVHSRQPKSKVGSSSDEILQSPIISASYFSTDYSISKLNSSLQQKPQFLMGIQCLEPNLCQPFIGKLQEIQHDQIVIDDGESKNRMISFRNLNGIYWWNPIDKNQKNSSTQLVSRVMKDIDIVGLKTTVHQLISQYRMNPAELKQSLSQLLQSIGQMEKVLPSEGLQLSIIERMDLFGSGLLPKDQILSAATSIKPDIAKTFYGQYIIMGLVNSPKEDLPRVNIAAGQVQSIQMIRSSSSSSTSSSSAVVTNSYPQISIDGCNNGSCPSIIKVPAPPNKRLFILKLNPLK